MRHKMKRCLILCSGSEPVGRKKQLGGALIQTVFMVRLGFSLPCVFTSPMTQEKPDED